MRKLVIGIYQLALTLASVPKYAPAREQSYCRTGTYHFATSYYARTFAAAEKQCESSHCDIIIEWKIPLGDGWKTGWDIGKLDGELCEQNPKMTAKIVWEKNFNKYGNGSRTVDKAKQFSWSTWSAWLPCSKTCDDGIQERTRNCPKYGQCTGSEFKQTRHCNQGNCHITASWQNWNEWSFCNVTCGDGSMQRTRSCPSPGACPGESFQSAFCREQKCPFWRSWSAWSDCSKSCGDGYRNRVRQCSSNNQCQGHDRENEQCHIRNCATWYSWSNWSVCSQDCDGGTQWRKRRCSENSQCAGQNTENRDCNTNLCARRTKWSNWSSCSRSCGNGNKYRTRNCYGKGCNGQNTERENRACNFRDCVTLWSNWSQCSASCGQGTQFRSRTCQGRNCHENLDETQQCRLRPCLNIPKYGPIDGQESCISRVDRSFDNFSMLKNYESQNQAETACRLRWDVCDIIVEINRSSGLRKTFEIGSTRVKPCSIKNVQGVQSIKKIWQGHFVGYGPVGQNKCLRHGDRFYDSFSQSKTFESLSLAKIYCQKVHHPSCDIIVEIRRPDFDRRSGDLKVVYEIGSTKQTHSNPFCPGRHFLEYDQPFSGWSNWSSCSRTCGQGSKTRTRTCSIQGQCYEKLEETSYCNFGQCPTWSYWNSWTSCSVTCGNGSKSRSRTCPVGGSCTGRDNDTKPCREQNCPTWSRWSSWSLCSVTCGNGSMERTRSCPIQGVCRGENYQTKSCQEQKCRTNSGQWNRNGRNEPRTYRGSKSADFLEVERGFISYGPANPNDSCSTSKGGALSNSFKHEQYAKDHCEQFNCNILTELSTGRFEIGSTTSTNQCDFQSANIKQQWIKV